MEAPAPVADGAPYTPPLRLAFREVWWAQSFGIQPLGTTIRWARVQAAEQVRHILIPVGRRLGRARGTQHALDHEIPQAFTYRPRATTASVSRTAGAPTSRASAGRRAFRPLLRGALAVYDGLQYVWKLVQWLVLTPIVLGLLALMSAMRVLSFIGIIRSALVASFNALSSYVMLHWIASTQVYMRDYSLAAEIRQRFEREVTAFLGDARCERVVVIAHSMGTVIAYEGLTTLLAQAKVQHGQQSQSDEKPITFICLAQALRRVWLLPGIDARRLHGVLPERVRWLHFWARYDPVAAGPLSALTLPRLRAWSDPAVPDPSEAIRASLERCENREVANTDSSFTDHTTYWENIEQVVGPIARELVVGHPAMEQVATAHLATPDDVPPPPPQLTSQQLAHYVAFWYFLTLPETLVLAVAAALALVAGTASMQAVGFFVARPSPFDAPGGGETNAGGTNWVFIFSAITLVLAFTTSLLFTIFVGSQVSPGQKAGTLAVTIFLLSLALAELANGIAFWAAVIDALFSRLWSWSAFVLFALFPWYLFDPYYRSALLAVAIAGCLVSLFRLARHVRASTYWALALQLVIILYIGIGALAADIKLFGPGIPSMGAYIESVLPGFFYGLWSVMTRHRAVSGRVGMALKSVLVLTCIYLALFYSLALGRYGAVLFVLPNPKQGATADIVHTTAPIGALSLGDMRVWVAVLVALTALAVALIHAVVTRRWIWLAAMPLVLAMLSAWLVLLRVGVGVAPVLRDDALAFSLVPLATALIYTLWADAGGRAWPKPRPALLASESPT